MWRLPDDHSEPVIRAEEQLRSPHRGCALRLPETAVVFFMSRGVEYLRERTAARLLPEPFPRFLNRCPIWEAADPPICFLDGGRGAPQACDTVETLAALGVKTILSVGMCGGYDLRVSVGEVIAPERAYVEEGTSLHYYPAIDYASPDSTLHRLSVSGLGARPWPIVTTDAVYRQTFRKEQLWREKGAVGVDMETSAVFSVSRYLGLRAVGILMVSDLHPLSPDAPKWAWRMTGEMRDGIAEKSLILARELNSL